jgi:hypothetical protein
MSNYSDYDIEKIKDEAYNDGKEDSRADLLRKLESFTEQVKNKSHAYEVDQLIHTNFLIKLKEYLNIK